MLAMEWAIGKKILVDIRMLFVIKVRWCIKWVK
jgi:hypothetical protein